MEYTGLINKNLAVTLTCVRKTGKAWRMEDVCVDAHPEASSSRHDPLGTDPLDNAMSDDTMPSRPSSKLNVA